MKFFKLILTSMLCFWLSNVASAWDNHGIETFIQEVTVLQNGRFYITAKDDLCDAGVNKIGVVNPGVAISGVTQTKEGVNMLLSVVLAAQMSNKKVKIYTDNSNGTWGCRMGAISIVNP